MTTTPEKTTISLARGDGIGPEIMEATLKILDAADAPLIYEEIQLGKKVYESGHTSGITPEAWDSIRRNKILLKAPITTPQGGGYKSLNVTLRKSLGLYANVRPCQAYAPFVPTNFPGIDLMIVRENEEDTYAGIEHRQTREVTQCLKLISRPGCERIVRYAFDLTRAQGRKKITSMTKDNIMKLTDGLFHQVFDEVAKEYPDIQTENMIIDIGAAHLADDPERFDVIVSPNLYGDILSDIAAQVAGSVGLCGSANIGREAAMFEAIHGSAPDIAGRDIANPSALLRGAVMMLVHLGYGKIAGRIMNAWLKTLEDGIHTADLYNEQTSKQKVGCQAFADAVVERLGQEPSVLPAVHYADVEAPALHMGEIPATPASEKTLVGVDIFLDWSDADRKADVLGAGLEALPASPLKLKMITNRGVKVYPEGLPETFCTDHWRCRFTAPGGEALTSSDVINLQAAIAQTGLDIIKTENLYAFDGKPGYSLGQGE